MSKPKSEVRECDRCGSVINMTLEDALEELEFVKDTTATIEINAEAYNKALKSLEAWIKINKALDGNIEALYQLDTAFDYVANIICDFLEPNET